jgi:energy-coupling factor transporter ATP-binding protein EcfA2
MTQVALAALREGNALAQTLTFEQLEAYHVPFDQLTKANEVEHELKYWAARRGRVALIGDSGAGKSSVMASVLGAFSHSVPDNLVPTRIPVELADSSTITEVGAFGRHIVRHILNWAAPEALSSTEREEIERRLSDLERRSGRRRRAGFSLGTGRLLPVDASLSGDLTGAASDFERQLGNGDVVLALRRLVDLFRARELEPFLVFDDTDAWLQLPGQEDVARELATGFFGSNVRMLSREIDCGFVLAVHRSYLSLPAYQTIADSLEAVDLPTFPDPFAAIVAILQRRIDVDEIGIGVNDAFAEDAIQALASIYSDVPDLRRIMAIAGLAVRKAHDDEEATVVTREAVIAARSQRDTLRGQPEVAEEIPQRGSSTKTDGSRSSFCL